MRISLNSGSTTLFCTFLFRLEKIVDRGKETERVYISLGLMALDSKDFQSGERCFRKALLVSAFLVLFLCEENK